MILILCTGYIHYAASPTNSLTYVYHHHLVCYIRVNAVNASLPPLTFSDANDALWLS